MDENQEPSFSIEEKLRRAEEEAKAARARDGEVQVVKQQVKRTAIPRKIRSKRRSTLSPEELEGLMGV